MLWLDLLDLELESELSIRPESLNERLDAVRSSDVSWVVIDEIQKIPKLLLFWRWRRNLQGKF